MTRLLRCHCRLSARELVVGWHGLAAGFTHMHSKGIVDQDIHLDNLLESVDRRSWVKTDMGNATWVKVQPLEEHFTELPFPM